MKQVIQDLKSLLDTCINIYLVSKYQSRMEEFRKLPPKLNILSCKDQQRANSKSVWFLNCFIYGNRRTRLHHAVPRDRVLSHIQGTAGCSPPPSHDRTRHGAWWIIIWEFQCKWRRNLDMSWQKKPNTVQPKVRITEVPHNQNREQSRGHSSDPKQRSGVHWLLRYIYKPSEWYTDTDTDYSTGVGTSWSLYYILWLWRVMMVNKQKWCVTPILLKSASGSVYWTADFNQIVRYSGSTENKVFNWQTEICRSMHAVALNTSVRTGTYISAWLAVVVVSAAGKFRFRYTG